MHWALYQTPDSSSTNVNFMKLDHSFHEIANKEIITPNS